MPTLYDVKPAFQSRLRPLVGGLARVGVTANQVTLTAAALSVALGAVLSVEHTRSGLFLLLPVWLFVRMALNAIDGMLAREHHQASKVGLYLNELCDLVSDAALALPFAFRPAFGLWGVLVFVLLALLSEVAGILGHAAGVGRNYAGPFGKSDRALALGLLGFVVVSGLDHPVWTRFVFPVLAVLATLTLINRVAKGART